MDYYLKIMYFNIMSVWVNEKFVKRGKKEKAVLTMFGYNFIN